MSLRVSQHLKVRKIKIKQQSRRTTGRYSVLEAKRRVEAN